MTVVAWFRLAHQRNFINAKIKFLDHLQAKLNEALLGPVGALLDGAASETWPAIKKLLQRETESAVAGISNALSGFDMDKQSKDKILPSLENYAKGVVEAKAREEAGRVLILMKERYQPLAFFQLSYFYCFISIFWSVNVNFSCRFSILFSHDSDSMPRVWTGKEDIRAITKTACTAV